MTSAKQQAQDETWMQVALALAEEAATQDEVPIGALVLKDEEIIGCGYNSPIHSQDPTAHAEILALRSAALHLQNYRLPGCSVYVSVEPCAMCVVALANARVKEVIYGCREPRTGCLDSNPKFKESAGLNWSFSHRGGVLEKQARKLMQDFFAAKRPKKN